MMLVLYWITLVAVVVIIVVVEDVVMTIDSDRERGLGR